MKLYLNRRWRPIGLWDVEAPTFSRHSAHRRWWGCQPYAPAGFLLPPRKITDTHFCQRLSRPQGHSADGRIRSTEKSNDIENRTGNLPACSTVPQPTTLQRAPRNSLGAAKYIRTTIEMPVSFFHPYTLQPLRDNLKSGFAEHAVSLWTWQFPESAS
jgi:hypothetical protein